MNDLNEIKQTISFGVPIDSQENIKGNTALHTAVDCEYKNAAEMLLKLRANVNATNNNKETPLHFAAYNTNTDLMKMLIDHGADSKMQNTKKRTPSEEFERHKLSLVFIESLPQPPIAVTLKHNYSKSNYKETRACLLTITIINYLLAILLYY